MFALFLLEAKNLNGTSRKTLEAGRCRAIALSNTRDQAPFSLLI
jgi:hypothetical protein